MLLLISKTNRLFSLKKSPNAEHTSVDKWCAQVPRSYVQVNLFCKNVVN